MLGACCFEEWGEESFCPPCLLGKFVPGVVKGCAALMNEAGEVFLKNDKGLPAGVKVADIKSEAPEVMYWVWQTRNIGGEKFQTNHFNYARRHPSQGGEWLGIYDPSTQSITPSPKPADF